MKISVLIFTIFLVLVVFGIQQADGRGGRGGSRGGYRSSSRSTSRSSSTSKVRYYRGPSYTKGSWKTAAAAGVVFGLLAYKSRSMYMRYPNREPDICFNEKNLRNGTMGYFVCPEPFQKDELAYCCGSSDEQYCCTLKDKNSQGRIIGIVIGVIAFCIIVGIVVYCCVKKRRQRAEGGIILKTKEQQPLTTNYSTASAGHTVPMQPYPPQPGMPPPQSGIPPPQGYDTNDPRLPYSTTPGISDGGMYPPQGDPNAYPPQGPLPYGPPGGPNSYPPSGDPNAYPPPGGPNPYPPADPNSYPPPPGGPNSYPPPPGGPNSYPPPGGPNAYPPPGSYGEGQSSYPGSGPAPIGFDQPDQKYPSSPPPAYPGPN